METVTEEHTNGAEVQVSCKLPDRDRKPGDMISAADLGRISDRVRSALVRTGTIRLAGRVVKAGRAERSAEMIDAKRALTTATKAAEKAAAAVPRAEAVLADATARRNVVAGQVKRTTKARRPHALKAATGDAKARNRLANPAET